MPFDLQGWELRDPWFLLFGLVAPLVYWWASRQPAALTYSSLSIVERAPRSVRARLAKLPAVLLAIATLTFSVALAGPRIGDATTRIHREGIAISLVVDRSGSMQIIDLDREAGKDRLEVVKEVLKDFVRSRTDDMIGLVVFGTYADSVCPLTLDHGNLQTIIDQVEVPTIREESETAVGDGLALACERLRDQETESKVVVLLTDGSSNAGIIEPHRAAELARDLGIRVYAVGAGDPVGPYYARVEDPRTGRMVLRPLDRQSAGFQLDEKTLRKIADTTGGRYFHAENRDALVEVYQQIDALERTKVTEDRYMEYEEMFAPWVIASLALLALAGLGSETIFRRLP